MKYLITGAAGFIGFHTSQYLLKRGDTVIAVDNLNDYYAVSLKNDRIKQIDFEEKYSFYTLDVVDKHKLEQLIDSEKPDIIIHLAAQAGVRYSLENPEAYINSNIVGFLNILEVCRHKSIQRLVYASSSSVYGNNQTVPFSIEDKIQSPVSLYGATKAADELMAYSYNHLFNIPMIGLRFFTVYGPWGRPDMAYFKFTKNIIEGKSIDVFNNGKHSRDFTYIDDIVDGIVAAANVDLRNINNPLNYKIYNLGNNKPVELMNYIKTLEEIIGKEAVINMLPMQQGDMEKTYADIDSSEKELGYDPSTNIKQGLEKFVNWYKSYYQT